MSGRLILIPWHIGNIRDVTLRAVEEARRLSHFLAEDPDLARAGFRSLGVGDAGKTFVRMPEPRDEALLEDVLARLEREDVGVLSSGGMPCLVDPGAWLVAAARARGAAITALPGPSAISSALALSGHDLTCGPGLATVVYALTGPDGRVDESAMETAARRADLCVILLSPLHFADVARVLARCAPQRRATALLDMTKQPGERYPYGDTERTELCAAWPAAAERAPWRDIHEVVLVLHPEDA